MKRQSKYLLVFVMKNNPDAGYSFPCNRFGQVEYKNLFPKQMDNYIKCQSGITKVNQPFVRAI